MAETSSEDRLDQLERRVADLESGRFSSIRAERVIVTGPSGGAFVLMATDEGPRMAAFDREGQVAFGLDCTDLASEVKLYDRREEVRVLAKVNRADNSTLVTLTAPNGEVSIGLHTGPSGPALVLFDENGASRLALHVTAGQGGKIAFLNAAEVAELEIQV